MGKLTLYPVAVTSAPVQFRAQQVTEVGARLDIPPVLGTFPCPYDGILGAKASSRSA